MFTTTDPACLTGLAIGDALGAWCETLSHDAKEFQTWDGRYREAPYQQCAAGESTDDAGMAQALAESLLEVDGYDREVAMRHYLKWFQGNPKGMGGTIRQAMGAFAKGGPYDGCGVHGAKGTGTVMRCAPIGVFFPKLTLDEVGSIARHDADLTHVSEDARDSSAFVAMMIAGILDHGQRLAAFHRARKRISDGHLKEQLFALGRHLPKADAFRILGPDFKPGGAVETTVIATGALLLTDTFEDALQAAIRAGGDTDTQAAIAGGMAGCFYGFERIPQWMTQGLVGYEQFRDLDVRLMAARTAV